MPRSKNEARPDAPYRIKDLSEKSGVSREAIRFYINEGLLPPAHKTAHNMGWYTERHVELLALIQKLQTERFLPLKAIKVLLQGGEGLNFTEAQTVAFDEMRRRIAIENRDVKVSDDPAKLASELGLSRWEQKELKDLGIAANGEATLSDIEITRQWIAIRDAGLSLERGFSPRDLQFMKDVVEIVLRSELGIFNKRIVEINNLEAAKVVDVVIPALNRIFSLLHERRVAEFVREIALQRAAVDRAAKRAPRTAKAKPGDAETRVQPHAGVERRVAIRQRRSAGSRPLV